MLTRWAGVTQDRERLGGRFGILAVSPYCQKVRFKSGHWMFFKEVSRCVMQEGRLDDI